MKDAELSQQDVVLVTGPSGAGKKTAIHVLEDLGFEAIDNLPLSLLPRLFIGEPLHHPVVVGVDARTRDFSAAKLLKTLDKLKGDKAFNPSLLFIDCRPDTLLNRYNETRRRHPLAPNETPLAGIGKELELLLPIRNRADVLIDTSDITPHELRAELAAIFNKETSTGLAISVQSFSYKRGTPHGLDMVIDCRFLRNPHWEAELRGKTGLDNDVANFVKNDPMYREFFEKLVDFTTLLLPAYKAEGKSYFSIGLGCTGGQHRSVCVTEELANRLAKAEWQVSIRHRELERLLTTESFSKGMKKV
jgi:RNase adapter protein RapZ